LSQFWTEKNYNELCEACDSVLSAPGSNFSTVAIPWLHVIRPHPVFLRQYDKLFASVHHLCDFKDYIISRLSELLAWYSYIWNPLNRHPYWWHSNDLSGSADILFVSHLINQRHVGLSDDFYFGDLPHRLRKQGVTSAFALINHTSCSASSGFVSWDSLEIPRFILSKHLPFFQEIRIRRRLSKESFRLIKSVSGQQDFKAKVFIEASRQSLSRGSTSNFRIALQVQQLVKLIRPRALVSTFEGHGWERIAFASARLVDPSILCFGYQHAALFSLQHAIYRDLGWPYDPDILLSSGPTPAAQLRELVADKSTPIAVIGSVRCSLPDKLKTSFNPKSLVLVLPEGSISECLLLFRFSLEASKFLPDVQFIWRLHPLVSRSQLLRVEPLFSNLPKNIIWSEASLESDVLLARWSIYRGSTSIFQAVAAGSLPIYLQLNNELSVDPLSDIEMLRPTISSVESLRGILSDERYFLSINAIQDYTRNCFTSLSEFPILNALKFQTPYDNQ